jgi:hypothetical protein
MRPENSAASNCRYGRKIPASNYLIRPENSAAVTADTAGKSRQVTTRYGWKIRLPVSTETAGKYQQMKSMNVLASYIQRCCGAVVEHLVHNLKVGGWRPPCAQLLFHYTAGKFRWRIKLNRKFRPTCQKLFLLYVRNESAAPGLGSGK